MANKVHIAFNVLEIHAKQIPTSINLSLDSENIYVYNLKIYNSTCTYNRNNWWVVTQIEWVKHDLVTCILVVSNSVWIVCGARRGGLTCLRPARLMFHLRYCDSFHLLPNCIFVFDRVFLINTVIKTATLWQVLMPVEVSSPFVK